MKKVLAFLLAVCMLVISAVSLADESSVSEKEAIEYALNLQHIDQEWTYDRCVNGDKIPGFLLPVRDSIWYSIRQSGHGF